MLRFADGIVDTIYSHGYSKGIIYEIPKELDFGGDLVDINWDNDHVYCTIYNDEEGFYLNDILKIDITIAKITNNIIHREYSLNDVYAVCEIIEESLNKRIIK